MVHPRLAYATAIDSTNLVIGVGFAAAFAFQWYRFRLHSYVVFFIASIFYLIANSLNLAFSLQAKSGAFTSQKKLSGQLLGLLMSTYTFNILAVLLTTQHVVRLLRTWSISMEAAAHPGASQVKTAVKMSNWLYWLYYVFAFGEIVTTALTLWVSSDIAMVAALFLWFYSLCLIFQFAIGLWLWLTVRKAEGEGYAFKRGQILILVFLVFFTPVEHMYPAYTPFGKSLRWIIYNFIAVYPNNLKGIDERVDLAAQDFKSGVEEMAKQDMMKQDIH